MSKILLGLIAQAALISTKPPVDSARFDLVCVGTKTSQYGAPKDFSERLHVDLTENLYCIAGNCARPAKIHRQTPDRVVFSDPPSDGYWIKGLSWWEPSTGQYGAEKIVTARAFIHDVIKATCKKSTFSGPQEAFANAPNQ